MNTSDSTVKTICMQHDVKQIVHELRNPLTAIALANQSLQDELEDNSTPTLSALTEIIERNVGKIEELIKQLIHHRDEENIIKTVVDINDIIDSSLTRVKDRTDIKKIKVVKNCNPQLQISGDAEKLGIAFLNVIVNAVEAVEHYAGKIWITAFQKNREVKVIIKDNGAGMDPSVSAQMFEKYFSTKNEGLGIGMWSTKRILEWHGASISVSSEPGFGTTIIITMQAAKPE